MAARYTDLKPDDLRKVREERALAVVPWGALEWHGPHLPLGLDGLVAEAFAEKLAERMGGILLPCIYAPITTLPHEFSLQVSTETAVRLFDETIAGLSGAGMSTIALVTGHYAQGHHIELYRAASRAMQRFGALRVFAATPLEPLGDAKLLDHAARCEVSQLLFIRPELVNLDALHPDHHMPAGVEPLDPKSCAVLGDDPRGASAAEGETLFKSGLDAWTTWMARASREELFAHYQESERAYASYVETYFKGSWEEAIHLWWNGL